jgi:geranylgeranyl diphosphate synthase type II
MTRSSNRSPSPAQVDLSSHCELLRSDIEKRLARYLDPQGRDDGTVSRPFQEVEVPPDLRTAMQYSLLGPGKRLRPLLVLMSAEACGGKAESALPAACAVEMIHAYSLVHDDLPAMDNDDLRRGLPTCHKKFDEATAILVGDGLLTLAFQVLGQDLAPPELAVECIRHLAWAAGIAGMVGGQMDDLTWEKRGSGTVAILESIHRRKTGALFRASVRLGALCGFSDCGWRMADGGLAQVRESAIRHPPSAIAEALDRYAIALGLAFQISDDLLDVEGRTEDTGKRVRKDAGCGKLTYPGCLGVPETRRRLQQTIEEAIGHLAPLGEAGRYLAALAQFIRQRNR